MMMMSDDDDNITINIFLYNNKSTHKTNWQSELLRKKKEEAMFLIYG